MLATLFLLGGCLPDKEKAEARRQERLSREVFAVQQELILTGDTAAAIAQLEKLNEKHPEQLEVIDALGDAYTERGDHLMAAFYYDYAFELAPDNADFALQAARAHESSGSAAEALSAYRAYLKLSPGASGLWRNIAMLEMAQENHQLALSAYLEALRADKVQPTAEDRLNIAVLYHKLGNQPQAQRWYGELLATPELEPQLRTGGLIGLFDLALRQKQWERALELMAEIDALSPGVLQEGDYASAYAELADWDKRRKEAAALAQTEKEKAERERIKAEKTASDTGNAEKAASEPTEAEKTATLKTTQEKTAPHKTNKDGTLAAGAEQTAAAPVTTAAAAGSAAVGSAVVAQDTATHKATVVATDVVDAAVFESSAVTVAGTPSATDTALVTQAAGCAANAPAAQALAASSTLPATTKASDARTAEPTQSGEAGVATVGKDAAQSGVGVATAGKEPTLADDGAATVGKDGTMAGDGSATAKDAEAAGKDGATAGKDAAMTDEDAEAAAQAASAVELAERGRRAFEAEDFEIAAELLERSAKLNPNNGEVLDMLSRASFRAGLFPQAERYAMLATYAEPQNVNYRLEYLRAYQRNHPPAAMLQQLISTKEAFPQDPNVTLALARGYEYIAQRKSQAASLYHEYLEMAPDSPFAEDIRQKLLEWEM